MTYEIPSPEGECILSYCPNVHVLTSKASVANSSSIIKIAV